MSLVAVAMVLGHVAIYGPVPQPDEGAAAHLFQLLLAGQVPIAVFFALKWLRRAPRPALRVLALHLFGVLACVATVYLAGLA